MKQKVKLIRPIVFLSVFASFVVVAQNFVQLNSKDDSFMEEKFRTVKRLDDYLDRAIASEVQNMEKTVVNTSITVPQEVDVKGDEIETFEPVQEEQRVVLKLKSIFNTKRYQGIRDNIDTNGELIDSYSELILENGKLSYLSVTLPESNLSDGKASETYTQSDSQILQLEELRELEDGISFSYFVEGERHVGILNKSSDEVAVSLSTKGPYGGTKFIFATERSILEDVSRQVQIQPSSQVLSSTEEIVEEKSVEDVDEYLNEIQEENVKDSSTELAGQEEERSVESEEERELRQIQDEQLLERAQISGFDEVEDRPAILPAGYNFSKANNQEN